MLSGPSNDMHEVIPCVRPGIGAQKPAFLLMAVENLLRILAISSPTGTYKAYKSHAAPEHLVNLFFEHAKKVLTVGALP